MSLEVNYKTPTIIYQDNATYISQVRDEYIKWVIKIKYITISALILFYDRYNLLLGNIQRVMRINKQMLRSFNQVLFVYVLNSFFSTILLCKILKTCLFLLISNFNIHCSQSYITCNNHIPLEKQDPQLNIHILFQPQHIYDSIPSYQRLI